MDEAINELDGIKMEDGLLPLIHQYLQHGYTIAVIKPIAGKLSYFYVSDGTEVRSIEVYKPCEDGCISIPYHPSKDWGSGCQYKCNWGYDPTIEDIIKSFQIDTLDWIKCNYPDFARQSLPKLWENFDEFIKHELQFFGHDGVTVITPAQPIQQ